jgi:hypothetical protein
MTVLSRFWWRPAAKRPWHAVRGRALATLCGTWFLALAACGGESSNAGETRDGGEDAAGVDGDPCASKECGVFILAEGNALGSVAINEEFVYFGGDQVAREDPRPPRGRVRRGRGRRPARHDREDPVPRRGGAVETLVPQTRPHALAVDGDHVYYVRIRRLYRVAKDGGEPHVLAENVSWNTIPTALQLDATSVYFLADLGTLHAGVILRVPKGGGVPSQVHSGDLIIAYTVRGEMLYSIDCASVVRRQRLGDGPAEMVAVLPGPPENCPQRTLPSDGENLTPPPHESRQGPLSRPPERGCGHDPSFPQRRKDARDDGGRPRLREARRGKRL